MASLCAAASLSKGTFFWGTQNAGLVPGIWVERMKRCIHSRCIKYPVHQQQWAWNNNKARCKCKQTMLMGRYTRGGRRLQGVEHRLLGLELGRSCQDSDWNLEHPTARNTYGVTWCEDSVVQASPYMLPQRTLLILREPRVVERSSRAAQICKDTNVKAAQSDCDAVGQSVLSRGTTRVAVLPPAISCRVLHRALAVSSAHSCTYCSACKRIAPCRNLPEVLPVRCTSGAGVLRSFESWPPCLVARVDYAG
jgi:hypothetical protein